MDFTRLKAIIEDTPLHALLPYLEEDYLQGIRHGDFPRWRERLAALPRIQASSISLGDKVSIGDAGDSDDASLQALEQELREFIPWRKGPFDLFGISLDTEGQSNLKWKRLEQQISPLTGKKILDVGCGNGYYGFRMLEAGADLVIGIDPHLAYVAQFWLLKHFTENLPTYLPIYVLPLSLEQMPERINYFDTVFSMGVIYHRRSPIDHLLQLKNCLRPGGELVMESIYVDGEKGYCLTPDKKYARMNNVWFVPAIETLIQWLSRCGFVNMEVIDRSLTNTDEQRQTEWMPYESLSHSLDPADSSLTIEGLPAPKRVVITATRPR